MVFDLLPVRVREFGLEKVVCSVQTSSGKCVIMHPAEIILRNYTQISVGVRS